MNLKEHFVTSIILTVVMYFFVGWYSLWAFVGGYLIDFDHYLWSLYTTRSLSVKKAYKAHFGRHNNEDYERDLLHIFHTWEFWVVMVAGAIGSYLAGLIFFYYMFAITFLGMAMHLAIDFNDLFKKKHFDSRAMSFFAWLNRKR